MSKLAAFVFIACNVLSVTETVQNSEYIDVTYEECTRNEYNVDDELNIVDTEVLKKFDECGWELLIGKNDLNQKYNLGYKAKGIASVPDKIIELSLLYDVKTRSTLIHELGHFVDSLYSGYGLRCKNWSSTFRFKQIVIKEYDKLPYDLSEEYSKAGIVYSNTEFFAEAVVSYYKYPLEMQESAPMSYEFIDKVINKIICEVTQDKKGGKEHEE